MGSSIGVVGHAGDGNFHPTVVFDGQDADQVETAQQAFDDIMVISLDLGGTITGEHGVGVLKMELLERELGRRCRSTCTATSRRRSTRRRSSTPARSSPSSRERPTDADVPRVPPRSERRRQDGQDGCAARTPG